MKLVLFVLMSGIVLYLAYRWRRLALARFFGLDPRRTTPAHAMRDGFDYEPAAKSYLLPQHFSAIAAAGPIVGPILAAHYFGWAPVWLWVILGAILIGGIHDLAILAASIRHRGRSIAELVKQYMNRRSYLLFLLFIWVSLVYLIIAFTDITASTFIQAGSDAQASANGQAVATSSMLYLTLAVVMGLVIRYGRISSNAAKVLFLPLVVVAIIIGPYLLLDVSGIVPTIAPQLLWDYILLAYCFLASLAPVWLLLQPRGDLGGYFLYLLMVTSVVGALVGGFTGVLDIRGPAFTDFSFFSKVGTGGGIVPPLFPVLFITVACGACSGFHSIVSSGTTSKQLDKETDAIPVAFGGMLLESFLAILSVAALMVLVSPQLKPDHNYASGIAKFTQAATFGLVPESVAFRFGLLCFATFVFDTLDAATRLARYVFAELTGWTGNRGRSLATLATLAVPVIMLSLPPTTEGGKAVPMWKAFWELFGTSNQLLVALSLLVASVWLHRMGKRIWITMVPAVFMLGMTFLSLFNMVVQYVGLMVGQRASSLQFVRFSLTLLLIALAAWIAAEVALFFMVSSRKKGEARAA